MERTAEPEIIEHFYGVYLLYCTNPDYVGFVYIGYTVDPNRRLKQHNKGKQAGGARKTDQKGPWVMVMIIHGFPNDISALRFEWAWQRPHRSRRLRHVTKRGRKEKLYVFKLRVLSEMLCAPPWNRLPLTVRWLNEDFIRDLPKSPPIHMPVCQGAVIAKKIAVVPSPQKSCTITLCYFCHKEVIKGMKCLNPSCKVIGHVICFAESFCDLRGEYVPVEGQCPSCQEVYLWGDLVRKLKGCYNNRDVKVKAEAGDDFCGSDSD